MSSSIMGYVGWKLLKSFDKARDRQAPKKKSPTPQPATAPATPFHWMLDGSFDFEVVGESYYQAAIAQIVAAPNFDPNMNIVAHLIPEHDNPHDDSSVRVEIDGLKVGHLSREDARSFRRRLGAKKLSNQITTCDARILGGGADNSGRKLDYGVFLDMKPFV